MTDLEIQARADDIAGLLRGLGFGDEAAAVIELRARFYEATAKVRNARDALQ